LRTPLTIIRSGSDLIDAEWAQQTATYGMSLMQSLEKSANSLGSHIELLLSGIATEAPHSQSPTSKAEQAAFTAILRQPAFFLPIGSLVITIACSYTLATLADTGRLTQINMLIQVAILILLGVCLYATLRSKHLHTHEKRELMQALASQSKLDGQRNQFIRQAAASLRTEISDLGKGVATLPETATRKLTQGGISRLKELIDRFALSAELKLADKPVVFKSVSLSSILSVAAPLIETIKSRHMTLHTPPEQLVVVRDPELMGEVVKSIIDNAVAYSPDGSSIDITCSKTPYFNLEVTDHGKGMPTEYAAEWFKPFSKVEGALSFDHEGAGLSLYLDRIIMTYLNGTVALRSSPGQGTTVTLALLS